MKIADREKSRVYNLTSLLSRKSTSTKSKLGGKLAMCGKLSSACLNAEN